MSAMFWAIPASAALDQILGKPSAGCIKDFKASALGGFCDLLAGDVRGRKR
jgi:hypothetical protein